MEIILIKEKTVILGITGSIAAYKAADIASKLIQAGIQVEVVMTEPATRFISPLTLSSITGRRVVTSMWELSSEFSIEHVALAEVADVVVIAPATASIIAHLAAGIADDMLTCTVLATKAPVIIAPAMNDNMYDNPIPAAYRWAGSRLQARCVGYCIESGRTGQSESGGNALSNLVFAFMIAITL